MSSVGGRPVIKLEPEDDEALVQCHLCQKIFGNDLAIHNHYKICHMDYYYSNNLDNPTIKLGVPPQPTESPMIMEPKEEVRHLESSKKKIVVQSFHPSNFTNITTNKDVSYVIIKAEDMKKVKVTSKNDLLMESTQQHDDGHIIINTDDLAKPRKRNAEAKERSEKKRLLNPALMYTGRIECKQEASHGGICRETFYSCCDYSKHYRDEHTKRRKLGRCQVCEKPLNPLYDPALPFPCEICGDAFSTNRKLNDHVNLAHSKLKPFQCSVCQKRFSQQGGVQQHMRMHTGDRPYKCLYCDKSFTQKSGLDQHTRIHTNEKPYKCVICQKSFAQSANLKQHMRTHTNVTPFQCFVCNKNFKQSSQLSCHLKTHNITVSNDKNTLVTEDGREFEIQMNAEMEAQIDDSEQAIAEQSIQVSEECIVEEDGGNQWMVEVITDER